MARKPKPDDPPAHSASYGYAVRLQAAFAEDPSVAADMPIERPGGLHEANASFEFRDAEGRVFKVIVSRQH